MSYPQIQLQTSIREEFTFLFWGNGTMRRLPYEGEPGRESEKSDLLQ
jgi:hypothetical protein